MTDTEEPTRPLVMTDGAHALLLELAGEREGPAVLALRVEVVGTSGAEYAYRFIFQRRSEIGEGDITTSYGELDVVIPGDDVPKLRGAVLDVDIDPRKRALAIRNPNRPGYFGEHAVGEAALAEGTVTERVERLIAEQINPALDAHSGSVELVGVEDGCVYVRLRGGCQGCAMATITLYDGIEKALHAAIPEVRQVVDVTDHATGLRPYFALPTQGD